MTTTNQKGSFAGKIAFVTGAGSGIGRATALAFARDGANVVVTDVSEQRNQETARLIEELGGRVLAVTCDVTRTENVKAALNKAVEAFGRVDFVGVSHGVQLPGQELFYAEVHLHGGPTPVRRFLPELIDLVWNGKIHPGKVFDLTLPRAQVAEGYRAMDERGAIKTLLRP